MCFVDSEISRCGRDVVRFDRVIDLGHFGALRFFGLVLASLGFTRAIRRLSMMVVGSNEFHLQWISRMREALWHILATLLLLSKLRIVLCVPHMFYTAFRKRYECSFWARMIA